MYASVAQARAAGAQGDDAAIVAALTAARSLIDRYTRDIFEPTDMTIVARLAPDGSALLPYRVRSVASVRPVGRTTNLAPSAYHVLSSSILGQIDAVVVGGAGTYDMLVLGAEPWAGGWSNLMGSPTGQLEVTGSFGPETVPVDVADAAAAIAAARTRDETTTSVTPVAQTDDEGNAVSITVDAEKVARRAPTTGVESVDALLVPYIRQSVTVN